METDNELATAAWRKAKASGGNGGSCVEVAPLSGGRVAVRDSKDRTGPALVFTAPEWAAFKDGMAKGEFNF
ncbi:DUF397 domain-containing protein [Nonomuraea angiospora]|uniref:DUF397 domain-containing protein n=1 Tax=Nonomuraea angiospora TaxID=46172 RepID=UPI00341047BF